MSKLWTLLGIGKMAFCIPLIKGMGMWLRVPVISGLVMVLGMGLFSGCTTVNWPEVRTEQAGSFQAELDVRTEAALAAHKELDLDACIDIALENSLQVRKAELERRIAKLNRKVAFANFLPTVQYSDQYTALNKQPGTKLFGSLAMPAQDKNVREQALQMQLNVFVPATWYLYSIHRRGEEIREVAAEYTQQMIAYQVTVLYFYALALEEERGKLAGEVAAAEALLQELKAYREEGMVSQWQVQQVEVLLLSRRNAVRDNARQQEEVTAELLTAMGLSPLAEIRLAPMTPLSAPEGALADLIVEALVQQPRLAIADRQVAIAKDKVKIAVTQFLPNLVGFLGRTGTSNSFMQYPDLTAMGVAGVLTVFDGFANVNAYKAARVEREQAFLEREELCFTVMLEVIRAYEEMTRAQDNLHLATAAAEMAVSRLEEVEAQWSEGLINPSDRLDAVAQRDAGIANRTSARFMEQVGVATLHNVLGATYMRGKVDNDEK